MQFRKQPNIWFTPASYQAKSKLDIIPGLDEYVQKLMICSSCRDVQNHDISSCRDLGIFGKLLISRGAPSWFETLWSYCDPMWGNFYFFFAV